MTRNPSQRGARMMRLVASLSVLLLVASACGDADPDPEPPTEAPAESSPEPPAVDPAPDPEPEEESDPPPPAEGEAELVWSILPDEEDRRSSVNALAVSADGDHLYVASDLVSVRHLADGEMVDAVVIQASPYEMALSSDGRLLTIGTLSAGLRLIDLERLDTDQGHPEGLDDLVEYDVGVRLHGGYDTVAVFATDGEHLLSGSRSGVLWLWDLSTGAQIVEMAMLDHREMASRDAMIVGLDLHPSGEFAASVDYNCTVDLWEIAGPSLRATVEMDTSSLRCDVQFSPDGELLAAVDGSLDQYVVLLDLDGQVVRRFDDMAVRRFGDLSFSPDSSMLATAGWRMPPTVWDVTTGDVLFSLDTGREDVSPAGDYNPTAIMFTPDGGHVVAGYADGTLELWRLPGAQVLVAPEREVCEPLPLPGDVLFATGSSVLRTEADPALNELAEQLRAGFDDATLTFVGHTDSRGDAASNQQLSLARAEAVRDWFAGWAADNGVDGWTLAVDGRGDTQLRASDTLDDGTFLADAGALNRRVEIEIDAPSCLP